jgi:HD-like signal output (HDOD) protein
METAAGFVQQLAEDLNRGDLELPVFPDSIVRIQQALRSEEVEVDEIVQLISSDPALAARVLHLANSAALRGRAEILDVRQAVLRIGNRLVQSSVIAFALRQAERNQDLTVEARTELKRIREESIELAARCRVIAKTFTRINADEALLAGLLSVLGQLYIFTKAQDFGHIGRTELNAILAEWHPAIAKAIAESWQLSEEMVRALELQHDTHPPLGESASLTEVLSAARLFLAHETTGQALMGADYPILQRLGIATKDEESVTLDQYAEAIDAIRGGLTG